MTIKIQDADIDYAILAHAMFPLTSKFSKSSKGGLSQVHEIRGSRSRHCFISEEMLNTPQLFWLTRVFITYRYRYFFK
jgi:hypothetical protein